MAPEVPSAIRFDTRLAVVSLVLALIPACLTQFVAFYLATRVIQRRREDPAGADLRRLAMAAQTCSVFMIPVTGLVAIALAVLLVPWIQMQQVQVQEREVILALRKIRDAQTEWRRRDPDRNGVNDYCEDGLAPLYDTLDAQGRPIALISKAVARADAGSTGVSGAGPYAGYVFRMLARDEEGIPYRGRAASAYGVAAWPASPHLAARKVFIVNEVGVVYENEIAGGDISEWPAKDPATRGWRPVR